MLKKMLLLIYPLGVAGLFYALRPQAEPVVHTPAKEASPADNAEFDALRAELRATQRRVSSLNRKLALRAQAPQAAPQAPIEAAQPVEPPAPQSPEAALAEIQIAMEQEDFDPQWSAWAEETLRTKLSEKLGSDDDVLQASCAASLCKLELALAQTSPQAMLNEVATSVPWDASAFYRVQGEGADARLTFVVAREGHDLPRPM